MKTGKIKSIGVTDLNSKFINDVADPTTDQGVATKKYADTKILDDPLISNNILMNSFKIAINGSLIKYNMIDGIVDKFEDESGVDTTDSLNEDYDSDNNLYSPIDSDGIQNMTLVSESTEAESNPDNINFVVIETDVDSITLNTDLKFWASRDDGANWVQATISDDGVYSSGKRILVGDANVSGQASDKTVRWKIETLNNKDLNIEAIGLLW